MAAGARATGIWANGKLNYSGGLYLNYSGKLNYSGSLITAASLITVDELPETSSADRTQLYKPLAGGRPGWARLVRKMLGGKAPPTEV